MAKLSHELSEAGHADGVAHAAVTRGLAAIAFDSLEEGICVEDARGRITFVNAAVERLLGWSAGELVGQRRHETIHPQLEDGRPLPLSACTLRAPDGDGRSGQSVETMLTRKDGRLTPVACKVVALPPGDGDGGTLLTIRDLSEQRRMERQLLRQTFWDQITGLPNRSLLMDRLGHALAARQSGAGRVAVLLAGLDRFHVINETLGHSAGDEVLRAAGERIARCAGPGVTVARFAGDAFIVLLEGVTRAQAVALAELIQEDLRAPIHVGGREVFLTAGVGVALSLSRGGGPGELLREAEIALRRAKASGPGRSAVYRARAEPAPARRLDLESDLWRACQRHEIQVHYQPIIELASGTISGVEALARWEHPRYGPIAPEVFIPLAIETGLMLTIGQWILEEACVEAEAWRALRPGDREVCINVNLSVPEVQHPDMAGVVARVLRRSGLPPRLLMLELTEEALIEDVERTVQQMQALKALGVRLAIDDFGTGFSSLSYLRRFDADMLKVDKSFVLPLAEDDHGLTILRAITSLGHEIGMEVTAEGIETAAQLAGVRAAGCDHGQGFLFGRAEPAEALRFREQGTGNREQWTGS